MSVFKRERVISYDQIHWFYTISIPNRRRTSVDFAVSVGEKKKSPILSRKLPYIVHYLINTIKSTLRIATIFGAFFLLVWENLYCRRTRPTGARFSWNNKIPSRIRGKMSDKNGRRLLNPYCFYSDFAARRLLSRVRAYVTHNKLCFLSVSRFVFFKKKKKYTVNSLIT